MTLTPIERVKAYESGFNVWLENNPDCPFTPNSEEASLWRKAVQDGKARKYGFLRHLRMKVSRQQGTHTKDEWLALCTEFDSRCVKCSKKITLTKDHIQPVCAGGSDAISNIQPLCRPCNSGRTGWFDWAAHRRKYGFNVNPPITLHTISPYLALPAGPAPLPFTLAEVLEEIEQLEKDSEWLRGKEERELKDMQERLRQAEREGRIICCPVAW